MAGIPNKGEGVRDDATAEARARLDAGDTAFGDIVKSLMARYQIAYNTAWQYASEARKALGLDTVKEQLVIGMEATAGSIRVARELEVTAREMKAAAESVADLDKVSAAFRRAGQQYLGTAQAAIKLDIGEAMSDEEQAEILMRAMADNMHRLPARERRRLADKLLEGDESMH